jgi:hypothetical protein
MVRKASNVSVSSIDVELERATDRASKSDRYRNREGSISITGSGGSSTIATNGSSGSWFLEQVTFSADGAGDAVSLEMQVRDSDDTVITRGASSATSGHIDMQRAVVKPGWDIHAIVTQSDGNSYTVNVFPFVDIPSPEDTQASQGPAVFEDFERSSPKSAYNSNNTSAFTVQSSEVYQNSQSLRLDSGASQTSYLLSNSGLSDYPEVGDTWKIALYRDSTFSQPDNAWIWFCAQSDDNFPAGYAIKIEPDLLNINEYDSGGTVVEGDGTTTEATDEWITATIDHSKTSVSVSFSDAESGSVSIPGGSFASGRFGFSVGSSNNGPVYVDYARIDE